MNRYLIPSALCLTLVLNAEASALVDIDMGKVDGKNLSGRLRDQTWSKPQKDGDITYRTKAAGSSYSSIKVPVWWPKDQMRPNEGDFFIVTVKYKDTLKMPAWFAALTGVGGWMTSSPVLGFGGDNDGKWKEAKIPLPWDYIIRIHSPQNTSNHTPDKTYFALHCSEDLAIASIKVEKAKRTPQLEAQFWADLRKARFARQKDVQKSRPHKPSSVSGLSGDIAAFPHSPDVSLLPCHAPQAKQVGKTIKVRMTRDEFQPATFGVYASKKLTNVNFKVSGLDGLTIKTKTASYSLTKRRKGPLWMVNAWYPAYAVDIEKGLSQSFLVDIRSEKGKTKPGEYKGTVEISSDQGKTSLPIEVKVDDILLLTMNEAGLTYGDSMGCLTPISDVRERIDYNQNSALLWYSGVCPRMWFKNGEMHLDFAYLDSWMVAAKKAGVENVVWFLGGEPFKYPYNLNLPLDIISRKKGGGGRTALAKAIHANPTRLHDMVRGDVVKWLKIVDAHAKKAGWPTIHYTPFDEPSKWTRKRRNYNKPGTKGSGPWIKDAWIDYAKLIKQTLPDAKIYASIHEEIHGGRKNVGTIFEPYLTTFCTNAVGRYPIQGKRMWEAVEKRKKTDNPVEFWQYGFVGDNDPGALRFSYGFFFGGWKSTGTMGWAYSNGGDTHDVLNASARKAWPTPFGNLPRACYVGLREGGDDRRLLVTCARKFEGNKEAMALLEKIRKAGREGRSKSKGGKDLTYDFWETMDNMQKLENWRFELLDQLLKVGK